MSPIEYATPPSGSDTAKPLDQEAGYLKAHFLGSPHTRTRARPHLKGGSNPLALN